MTSGTASGTSSLRSEDVPPGDRSTRRSARPIAQPMILHRAPRRARRHVRFMVIALAGLVATLAPISATPSGATFAGEQIALGQWLTTPAALSTSGDFATDTFSDPWDFSNAEDVIPIDNVGSQDTFGMSYSGGMLNVATRDG